MYNKDSKSTGDEKRRPGRPATGTTQKHISFRCDLENIEYLNTKENKGGFLNKLLKEAREREGWPQDCAEMPPEAEDEMK